MRFICKAKNGKLDFGSEYNQNRLAMFLSDNEGKELYLEKPERKRSLSQNNFYWLYMGVIERETGNSAQDLHEYFKARLIPKKLIVIKGENEHKLKVARSTSELNKIEFGEYLDKICALTGVPIPDPVECGYSPDWAFNTGQIK